MTDAFLAKVVSYDKTRNLATVLPMIVETDGTDRPRVDYPAVAGVTPAANDIVLVVTIRNGADNQKISRYYEASESNGRVVHVVKPSNGVYKFTGDFEFKGNVKFDGDVKVTGKLDVDQDTTILGNLTVQGNASVAGTLGCGSLQSQPPGSPVIITDGLNVVGDMNVAGAANVAGALDVAGALTAASATIGSINFLTHTHISNTPGLPTGPPE